MLSVFDAARDAPDAPALVDAHGTLTFAGLAQRTAAAVAALAAQGVTSGSDAVALVGSSERGTLIVLQALVALGVPAVLVQPRLTPRERDELFDAARPAAFLDPDRCRAIASAVVKPLPFPKTPPDDERALAVIFTSGTTGRPRGVALSRRAFVASAHASEQNLGWREDDRWLLGLGIAHVGGLGIVTRCLAARRCVVVPPPGPFDPRRLAESIACHRVTLLSLVPTQLGRLLALEPLWEPPRHLRALLLGGAAAPVALLDAARARGVPVLTTYGLTEACSQVATQAPGTPCSAAEGAGRPLPGIGVRVVDGEIQVRGPTLPSGYVGGDPPPLTADGWLRTGDRGWLDAEGRLHVLGRAGDVIVTGGEKVHPLEVERVLEAFAGVTAACAVGVRDPVWGQRVVALVVAQAGSNLDLADLWRWTREKLATFKRPRRMALVGELPLSPGGKLDRAAAARIASCLGDSDFFEHQA